MENPHSTPEIKGSSGAVATAEFASSLQGLLAVSRAVRSGADVGSVLDTIARADRKSVV